MFIKIYGWGKVELPDRLGEISSLVRRQHQIIMRFLT